MTTANIAEVLKLAAKPTQYDNDEKTWLEFRFKLENYPTLVDERYVALLLNAESQPVANLPTRTEESAVTIRTLSHTLYALLATTVVPAVLLLGQDCPTSAALRAAGCGNINLLATATRKHRSSASYASLLLHEMRSSV